MRKWILKKNQKTKNPTKNLCLFPSEPRRVQQKQKWMANSTGRDPAPLSWLPQAQPRAWDKHSWLGALVTRNLSFTFTKKWEMHMCLRALVHSFICSLNSTFGGAALRQVLC